MGWSSVNCITEQSSTVRAQPPQGSVENAYRYQFEITDDIETSDIIATVTIRDISQNVATIEEGRAIDSRKSRLGSSSGVKRVCICGR